MTSFFTTIPKAIYSTDFYKEIPLKPMKKILGYFFLLILLIVVIQTAVLAVPILTQTENQLKTWLNTTINYYPTDLVVTIQKGRVSTNATEPYFIPFPPQNASASTDQFNNLVVIDTKTPFTITQFNEYKTVAWMAQDSIFYYDRQQGVKTMDLSKIDYFKVDKSFIQILTDKIGPWLKFAGPGLVVLILIGLFLANTLRLIQLLIIAFLVWLLLKVMKKGVKYWDAYKISLYAITLGLVVELTLSLFHLGAFPFMFTLLTLVVVIVNQGISHTNQPTTDKN